MAQTLKIASRRSQLAMTQTNMVAGWLQALDPELAIEIVPIVTRGDQILDVTLSKVGGKGLFVSEIEQALLDGRADLAVHSMKDVPAQLAPGLTLAGIPAREDPRDAFISANGQSLSELRDGAVIGTSSLRRVAQLLALRPDLEIRNLRGNIDTRLRKLADGEYDAILLAAAGLNRMGWGERITERLDPDLCLPAIAQGILGIECRESDEVVRKLCEALTDRDTALAAKAERSLLEALNGGCQVPLAGLAQVNAAQGEVQITLTGLVADVDGRQVLRAVASGRDPVALGQQVAAKLRESGADRLLAAAADGTT